MVIAITESLQLALSQPQLAFTLTHASMAAPRGGD